MPIKPCLLLALLCVSLSVLAAPIAGASTQPDTVTSSLTQAIQRDYQQHLKTLFEHFHSHPELSFAEVKTAKRLAKELRAVGFKVTEGIGGTGVVAIMENGAGPLVMMRADMDALPLAEQSGLPYASRATQTDPITGKTVPVMHACGHDVHITSLVGTARQMARQKDLWSGTLMLIGQPGEERIMGARKMMADRLWERFGKADYALAFHVSANLEAGKLSVSPGAIMAGADSVDIIVHGIGAHGASPHAGKDPIVLASQIVLALQTLVSRELSPREPAVVTVGSFHAGSKHNIISDKAHLQLTVRNTSLETRQVLLDGIKRIAENLGRAAGLPEDKLPEVIYSDESTPPTLNDPALTERLRTHWINTLGEDHIVSLEPTGMGAEDFPQFTTAPYIPSVYFGIGGTPKAELEAAKTSGKPFPSHHSPFFKIAPEPAVTLGVEATVIALQQLLQPVE